MHIIDRNNKRVRFTDERKAHLADHHPEMIDQLDKIRETLKVPDCIIKSKTDTCVQLFYKYYVSTPVKAKLLCVVVKFINDDNFIITAYFTDIIKKGELLWKKK